MSLLLPTFGVLTINQEWSFGIDFLGITYKPWRLFLVVCSTPCLICALVLIFFIPESPKFVLAQGDEEGTLEILRKIYQVNTGRTVQSFGVTGILEDEEFGSHSSSKSEGFFHFFWSQTAKLFKGAHLKNITTACFLQFAACNASNGFWTFLPEIVNKISIFTVKSREPATVCDIFVDDKNLTTTITDVELLCNEKLELGMFKYVYEVIIFFAVGYTIMSLTINRVGKLWILLFILLSSSLAAFSLTFLNITSLLPYVYMYLISPGLCVSIVNASTVEL